MNVCKVWYGMYVCFCIAIFIVMSFSCFAKNKNNNEQENSKRAKQENSKRAKQTKNKPDMK